VWRELIAKYVPGKTFVDVGCMWKVDGAYSFHALRSGASAVTGIDMMEPTPGFCRQNTETGDTVGFFRGNLNDPAIESWAGSYDVVFCAGVLYHVPNPVYSLLQLRKLCNETLILTSASTMDHKIQNVGIFLPRLDDQSRTAQNFQGPHGGKKVGLDRDVDENLGFVPWFWLLTPSAIRSMVEAVGFEVKEFFKHRRVTTLVATRSGEPVVPPL